MIDHAMTNADYHAHSAISKSGLDLIDRSPAHYIAGRTEPRKETPAMTFGTACHAYVLEPHTFNKRYITLLEKIDRRTKEGKAQWATFQAEAGDREVLERETFENLVSIGINIMNHPVASELLDEKVGKAELSVFGNIWGVDVKCRPDWLREDGIVVDLKTTDNASPSAFAKSCASYRYHVQAAYYTDILATIGQDIKAFVFIAVEKTAPYAVGVYEIDAEAIEAGREAYQRNLDTYKRCMESGHWPAYSDGIETLTLPRWIFNN